MSEMATSGLAALEAALPVFRRGHGEMIAKNKPPEKATEANLWVEPEQPTLAGLAQLLAGAEACGLLPQALWLVGNSEYGELFFNLVRGFEEIGPTWVEVALGLEQAAQLLRARSASEQQAVLAVGVPLPQLLAALRVRQALSIGREHERAGELAARLAPIAREAGENHDVRESGAGAAAVAGGSRALPARRCPALP
jgi:hypothetical protein